MGELSTIFRVKDVEKFLYINIQTKNIAAMKKDLVLCEYDN